MPTIPQLPSDSTIEGSDLFVIYSNAEAKTVHATKSDTLKDAAQFMNDDSITPAKRTGGYKIGTIAGTTVNTTGNKAITGIGFKPKLVRLGIMEATQSGFPAFTDGGFTADAQYCRGWAADPGAGQWYRWSSTSYCIQRYSAIGGTPLLQIARVSMDNDGFTINVSNASNIALFYEAYA